MPDLRMPILLDPDCRAGVRHDDEALAIRPTHIASWESHEPSSSQAGPSRRIALACEDNTIWIILAAIQGERASRSKGKAKELPQIVIPSSTSASPSSQKTSSSSRPTRPAAGRSSSFTSGNRHRASSTASSILSSSSRRRSSALSPPPSASPLAAVSATFASADPHLGHDHRNPEAERSGLLSHLREQRGSRSSQDDARLGLGIGGIGRRGLPGVHSKDDIAETSGAVSPRSSRSVDSPRNISSRLMGWVAGEEAEQAKEKERDRRELMEMVQEVEVEREMAREVEEGRREVEEEEMIKQARVTPVGTPTLNETGDGRGAGTRRIVLREAGRGKIVHLQVHEELGILTVLRDIGILDVISLVELCVVDSMDLEEPEQAAPSKTRTRTSFRMAPFWKWRRVLSIIHASSPLLVVHGLPWPCGMPNPNGEITRVIMIRAPGHRSAEIVARLDLPGQGDIGFYRRDDETHLLHASGSSLTAYPLTSPAATIPPLPERTVRTHTPQSRSVSAALPGANGSSSNSSSPESVELQAETRQLRKNRSLVQLRDAADQPLLPYPPEKKERERSLTKFLAQRRAEKEIKPKSAQAVVSWGVGEGQEVRREGSMSDWTNVRIRLDGSGVGFGPSNAESFVLEGLAARTIGTINIPDSRALTDCQIHDELILFLTNSGLLVYDSISEVESEITISSLTGEFDGARAFTSAGLEGSLVLYADRVDLVALQAAAEDSNTRTILSLTSTTPARGFGSVLPRDIDTCFVADPAGNVAKAALADLLRGSQGQPGDEPSMDRLDSRVTCMQIISSDPAYLVAGDEDGIVRIWNAESFELQGSWSLFAFPVHSMALLDMPQAGALRDHLFCASQAGTVGIISLTEMEQMFLIPASRVPLRRAFIGGKDLMLAYANGKTRVWNFETQEFRRSTGLDAAEEMLNAGDWAEITLTGYHPGDLALSALVPSPPGSGDLGGLLELDIRALSASLTGSRSSMDSSPLNTLRVVLAALIPFGGNAEIDRICREELGVHPPSCTVLHGERSGGDSQSLLYADGDDVWRISPQMTGTLQLAIATLLRPFLDSPEHERWAAQLIAYFSASLPETAVQAGLPFFAAYYLDPIADIHQSARMLFGCQMDAMSEVEIEAMADLHLAQLPSFLPSADQHLEAADLALTMLGGMALHKYQSMTSSVLKAIAESIFIYLNSTDMSHLALAIELASKGFTTWQAFVDPAELLRRLFFLSIQSVLPNTSTAQNSHISAQARLAVLHVASSNAALFMSTLSMDILDARSAEGRKSIMKLCVYMARKRPQVLENSLPKVVEAVVKSLDPNVGRMREDVQQTATVILNELVLAFSTIDFNAATQKLAVGTHEGALIMYDLKTASRLYVLEPHKHPVSAVNFSPDGRRLITVSLEEGNLTVWKIGSSLSGFFNVGGPPRQGGKAGEPFKRIDFARADNVPLDSTSALSDVQISWPGDRQAKVVIKETAMTFET